MAQRKRKRQEAEAQRLRAQEKREQEEYDEDQHYKPQQSNKKRSEVCRFYGKGKCNKGSERRFRHDEEDLDDTKWGKEKSWNYNEEQEEYKNKWQKHKGGADLIYKHKNDYYKSDAVGSGSGGRYGASAASSKQSC